MTRSYLSLCVILIALVGATTGRFFAEHLGPKTKIDEINAQFAEQFQHVKKIESTNEIVPEFQSPTPVRSVGDTWISITKTTIQFYRLSFINATLAFAIDIYSNVWMSTDAALTWTKTNIDTRDRVGGIYPAHGDRNTIFFLGGWASSSLPNNASWVTSDGGATFTRVPTNVVIDDVLFHPTQRDWLLGVKGGILFVSQNMGSVWTAVRDDLSFATWCHAGRDNIPMQRICMIYNVKPEDVGVMPGDTDGGLVGPSRFVNTDDLGYTITVMFPLEVNYLIVHHKFFFVLATDTTGVADLFVSADHGITFKNAKLPGELTVPYLYPEQFLDDSTGAIWLGISQSNVQYLQVKAGNLYVSDTTGYRFSEALRHTVMMNNWWDFDVVHSLEGTYLANYLVSWHDENSPDKELSLLVKTVVTYDNGDTWHKLHAPDFDSNGIPYNCTGDCSLNLFGKTTWLGIGGSGFFGDFYSSENAVGLIMGTGNVGQFLLFEEDAVSTYLSRDGGASWFELMKGSTVYEYGNHGGILVLVKNQVPTTTLYYSLDEGLTIQSIEFTTEPIVITSIFTTATHIETFIIYGQAGGRTVFYGIDMSAVHETTCTPTDLENWSPVNGTCVLGHTIVYSRRKRTAQCFYPDDKPHIVSQTNCDCTDKDYECDYGFEKTYFSNTCAQVESDYDYAKYIEDMCKDPANGHYYYKSTGYRLIPGDTCVNQIQKYQPIPTPCAPEPSTGSSGVSTAIGTTGDQGSHVIVKSMSPGLVAFIVILILVVMAGSLAIGMIAGAKSERIQGFINRNRDSSGFKYSGVRIQHDDDEEDNTIGIDN